MGMTRFPIRSRSARALATAWLLLATLLLLLPGAGALSAQDTARIAPPDVCGARDDLTAFWESHVRKLVSDTSADYRAVRDSVSIPAGRASDVSRVTSDSVCALALAALRRVGTSAGNMPEAAYVWRMGPTRYYVWHRHERRMSFHSLASIFDAEFAVLLGRLLE